MTADLSQPQSKGGRVRFRSRGQFYALLACAPLFTALGLIGATQASYTAGKIVEAFVAVILGGVLVFVAVRAALLVGDEGITIRNPLGRTVHISWTEIAGFKIGRYKLLGRVCLVELRDGSTVHAWAIQVPNASRNSAATREAKMIEELNRLRASPERR